MLPKNRLRAKRLERLFIFPDDAHPYEANLLKDHAAEFGKTWKKEKLTGGGLEVEGAPAMEP
jgi:large subunit ribosomal protein L13